MTNNNTGSCTVVGHVKLVAPQKAAFQLREGQRVDFLGKVFELAEKTNIPNTGLIKLVFMRGLGANQETRVFKVPGRAMFFVV